MRVNTRCINFAKTLHPTHKAKHGAVLIGAVGWDLEVVWPHDVTAYILHLLVGLVASHVGDDTGVLQTHIDVSVNTPQVSQRMGLMLLGSKFIVFMGVVL